MLDNILALEDSIGDANAADEYLASDVSAQKLETHEILCNEFREKQEKM